MIERQTWTTYNAAQSEEKHRFVELLADLCSTVPQPPQHGKGRPRLPLSDIVFASVYKVYVGFSARRFTSDLRDAFVGGHVDSTPHFNSVNRYLSDPQLASVLKELITVSSLPLKAVETDFAVDSSGFSTSRFVRWFNKKYGREVDNREWVKVHKRSNIETAYSMIKGKFGSAIRSKSDTGQINEALCKVLAHNICVLIQAMHALNIHPIFSAKPLVP